MTGNGNDENNNNKDEGAPPDALGAMGISRRRLAYMAPAILLSRKMIYRAAGCGKDTLRKPQCTSALRGS